MLDIEGFEADLKKFLDEVNRKTFGPLSELCMIFDKNQKSFIEAASEYNHYRQHVEWEKFSKAVPILSQHDVDTDRHDFPIIMDKYINFRAKDQKSAEKFFSSYPPFQNAEYSRTVYGKTRTVPSRPGCNISDMRAVFLRRLQNWSLKTPKKYANFPEEIRKILTILDTLQLIKFILSFCSWDVCEQAINESPILNYIGFLRPWSYFTI